MDLENINGGELKDMCKAFNTMVAENDEFGACAKIKVVGVKLADLVQVFIGAMDQILTLCEENEELENLVPDDLAGYYNHLVDPEAAAEVEEEATEDTPEPEEEPEEEPEPKKKPTPKPKAEPKAKAKAEPKPKAEKKAKEPEEKSRYGHKLGSQAAALDDALFKDGGTYETLSKKTGRSIPGVKSHIQHLKNMGIEIVEKDGFFKVKG